jgi:hypothetical protein
MSGTIFEVVMIVSRSFFLVLRYFEWVRQSAVSRLCPKMVILKMGKSSKQATPVNFCFIPCIHIPGD